MVITPTKILFVLESLILRSKQGLRVVFTSENIFKLGIQYTKIFSKSLRLLQTLILLFTATLSILIQVMTIQDQIRFCTQNELKDQLGLCRSQRHGFECRPLPDIFIRSLFTVFVCYFNPSTALRRGLYEDGQKMETKTVDKTHRQNVQFHK